MKFYNQYVTANNITECNPYLYLWEDRGTWIEEFKCYKKYLGIHNGKSGYRYSGSGPSFILAFNERPEDFHRTIILHDDSYEFVHLQEETILKAVSASSNTSWYNNLEVSWPIIHTDTTKKKLSLAATGRIFSEETKAKIGEKSRNRSNESKIKLSESLKGKKKSTETKLKLSLAAKGKTKTEETKSKMKEAWIIRRKKIKEKLTIE